MFKLEKTGWTTDDMATAKSRIIILPQPRPLDELIVHMLANSCGGSNYRVKDGVIKHMEADDGATDYMAWRREWVDEKGWIDGILYHFTNSHNDPAILVSFKWSEDEDSPELLGGEVIGYGFNYC